MTVDGRGFFDLQVNGYSGLDFNSDHLDAEKVRGVCARLRADGVTNILATVITASLPRMLSRIDRIASLIETDSLIAKTITGIHVEGPFISSVAGYVGAHPAMHVIQANLDTAKRLIDAGGGHVKLVTLAPEADANCVVIGWLRDREIVVAGGHSDASIECLRNAIDAGMSLFTHLGNGCPPALPRHDNIVQRVLSLSDRLFVSFIADGHHVPLFALRNYLKLVPQDRVIIVTDAISAAGLGPGRYALGDQFVEVDQDGAAWSSDRTHFAGCATPMNRMVEQLRSIAINDEKIAQWTRANPRRLLGLP